MTQTETITWHKYPDEKPERKTNCIVCVTCREIPVGLWWDGYDFYGLGYPDSKRFKDQTIIAWAELPKGWGDEN